MKCGKEIARFVKHEAAGKRIISLRATGVTLQRWKIGEALTGWTLQRKYDPKTALMEVRRSFVMCQGFKEVRKGPPAPFTSEFGSGWGNKIDMACNVAKARAVKREARLVQGLSK